MEIDWKVTIQKEIDKTENIYTQQGRFIVINRKLIKFIVFIFFISVCFCSSEPIDILHSFACRITKQIEENWSKCVELEIKWTIVSVNQAKYYYKIQQNIIIFSLLFGDNWSRSVRKRNQNIQQNAGVHAFVLIIILLKFRSFFFIRICRYWIWVFFFFWRRKKKLWKNCNITISNWFVELV